MERPIMSFTMRSPVDEKESEEDEFSEESPFEETLFWEQPAKANERIERMAKGMLFFIFISSKSNEFAAMNRFDQHGNPVNGAQGFRGENRLVPACGNLTIFEQEERIAKKTG